MSVELGGAFVVALPRLRPIQDELLRLELGELVEKVLDDAMSTSAHWVEEMNSQIAVEAFRTLA